MAGQSRKPRAPRVRKQVKAGATHPEAVGNRLQVAFIIRALGHEPTAGLYRAVALPDAER